MRPNKYSGEIAFDAKRFALVRGSRERGHALSELQQPRHAGQGLRGRRRDSSVIRRRRVCLTCNFRFTTFERVQLRELVVIKRNGRRVPFDRDKLLRSVQIALRKRPVEPERIDQAVSKIVRELESQGESEISSETVGEMVMEASAHARRRRLCALRLGLSQFPRSQGFRGRARRIVGRGGRQASGGGEEVSYRRGA